MKKNPIIAVLLSIAVASSLPFAYAETNYMSDEISSFEEVSSDFDFPEGEGINFFDKDISDIIEMPSYEETALLSDENEKIYISTVDDLTALRKNMLSSSDYTVNKIFVLQNDIDLGGSEWSPLGYSSDYEQNGTESLISTAFKGTFDGAGHTIRNFRITDNQYTYMGLFGAVAGGTIKNLNIEDASIRYSYSASGGAYGSSHYPSYSSLLVGFSNYATISNCNVSGTISITCDTAYSSSRYISIGMITGAGLAKIDSCKSSGTIDSDTAMNAYCGGIYGNAGSSNTNFIGSITNSSSSVNINAKSNSSLYAGGIIARSSTSIETIDNCRYTGTSLYTENTRASSGSTGTIPVYTGGIAGYCYSPITNCTVGSSQITVSSVSSPTGGGITGRTVHRIEDCTSDASVNVTLSGAANSSTPSAGGITGVCGSTYSSLDSLAPVDEASIPAIRNCTVGSGVSLSVKSAGSNFTVAGGIAGALHAPSEIVNCVSDIKDMTIDTSLSGEYIGGICGYLNGGSVEYCKSSGKLGINFSSMRTLYLGGIAGTARTKRFLTYDTSHGIIDDEFVTTKVYGSYINGCSSDMILSGKTSSTQYIGGIAGYMSGLYSSEHPYIQKDRELILENSAFTGSIELLSGGKTYAGGIAGFNLDSSINNAYSIATIECAADDDTERFIGGAVGGIKQNDHSETKTLAAMENCYTYSTLSKADGSTKTTISPFVAEISPSSISGVSPSFVSCYYESDDADAKSDNNILPLTSESFKSTASFEGFDFERLWEMTELRPQLRFEDTCLYMPVISDVEGESKITSILISRPQLNSSVYIVEKDADGKVISNQSYKLNNELIQTEAFATLPCDISISNTEDFELYFWTSKNEPLMDKTSIGRYISKFIQ
ncbi:MAG: hypothetical protein Q4G33_08655 [bacterium]|nr:hypothetical protein [bacterium]